MEKIGLCENCIYSKDCSLSRKLPVTQCEEFSSIEPDSDIEKKNNNDV
jgi:hypothetical protein